MPDTVHYYFQSLYLCNAPDKIFAAFWLIQEFNKPINWEAQIFTYFKYLIFVSPVKSNSQAHNLVFNIREEKNWENNYETFKLQERLAFKNLDQIPKLIFKGNKIQGNLTSITINIKNYLWRKCVLRVPQGIVKIKYLHFVDNFN